MTEEVEGKTSQDWYRELLETLDRLYGKGSLSDKEMKSPENHAISLACGTRRRVACLETGETFESAVAAAKAVGLKSSSAISACLRGSVKTAGGYHWAFEGSDATIEGIEADRKRRIRRVVCLETGEIFDNASEAARTVGIKCPSGISACLNGKTLTAGGLHWTFEGSALTTEQIEAERNDRRVVCLETGEIFDNATAAARAVGMKYGSGILACLKGKVCTAGGLHWAAAESGLTAGDIPSIELSKKKSPSVCCVETGEVFASPADASSKTGVSRTAVYDCLKGRAKSARGLHWVYATAQDTASSLGPSGRNQ